jgi:hypothetical protein
MRKFILPIGIYKGDLLNDYEEFLEKNELDYSHDETEFENERKITNPDDELKAIVIKTITEIGAYGWFEKFLKKETIREDELFRYLLSKHGRMYINDLVITFEFDILNLSDKDEKKFLHDMDAEYTDGHFSVDDSFEYGGQTYTYKYEGIYEDI